MKKTLISVLSLLFLSAVCHGSIQAGNEKITAHVTTCYNPEKITAGDIIKFLKSIDHHKYGPLTSCDGGLTWVCFTQAKGEYYITTIYTDGVNIVGWEDDGVN